MNGLSTILHNHFYYGLLFIKASGETYVGIHEPLIDRVVFEEVQERLRGRKNNAGSKHAYLFQKLLRCGTCARNLIAETQKKRYIYYRCHTRTCVGVCLKEEYITKSLIASLSRISLSRDDYSAIKEAVTAGLKDHVAIAEAYKTSLFLTQERLKERGKRLMDALLDQTISRDEFNDRKIELNNEELSIRVKLDGIKDGVDDRLETISDTLELLKQLSIQDFSEDGEQILQIAKRASSNFSISGNSLVLTWVSPLDALVNLTDGEECDLTGNRTLIYAVKGRRPNR